MVLRPGRATKIGVLGLGRVGVATGVAFAAHGFRVTAFDIDAGIRAALGRGVSTFREPGLDELLRAQVRSRRFLVAESVQSVAESSEGIFLCVPTPPLRSGRIDLRFLLRSVRELATALQSARGFRTVVIKSTVVPGTTETIVVPMLRTLATRSRSTLGVASNPEFLSEGSMVRDALHPSRVVVGTTDSRSLRWLRRVYRPFRSPIVSLTPSGAELVKYSANTLLALKVSFANEVSRIADRLGVNVDQVMLAVGQDPRIGEAFLRAGPGFGGSCFEKDLRAFASRAEELGVRLRSARVALKINRDQLAYALGLVQSALRDIRGKRIALLGLSFKAGTDDVRGSRALPVARALITRGATVIAHDPMAIDMFRTAWEREYRREDTRLRFADSLREALTRADAAIIQADWPLYMRWTPELSRLMNRPIVIDLRRTLPPRAVRRSGLEWIGLGAGTKLPGSGAVTRVPKP